MHRKPFITLALGAALVATLAGCSGESTPSKTKTPAAAPTQSSVPAETVYNECKDGLATIDLGEIEAGKPLSLGDCAQVSVVGKGAADVRVELGTVGGLVVEASNAVISVQQASSVIVPGSGNTVSYGGDAQVQDLGADNTITAG